MPSSKNNAGDIHKKIQTGRNFEKLAAQFFVQDGFTILEKNYQVGHKEIDLIVKKENLVVFVEVKSSSSMKFGHPAERVDSKKIANLSQAAADYLIKNNIDNCDLRFDVVTFTNGKLDYYPNAFDVTEY